MLKNFYVTDDLLYWDALSLTRLPIRRANCKPSPYLRLLLNFTTFFPRLFLVLRHSRSRSLFIKRTSKSLAVYQKSYSCPFFIFFLENMFSCQDLVKSLFNLSSLCCGVRCADTVLHFLCWCWELSFSAAWSCSVTRSINIQSWLIYLLL